jgi:hypothetical protein
MQLFVKIQNSCPQTKEERPKLEKIFVRVLFRGSAIK